MVLISSAHERVDDLVTVLDRLEMLHRELEGVIGEKIEHMRASDVDGMREMTQREGDLVRKVAEQEGRRRQLIDVIGAGLGMSSAAARTLHVRQLAKQLDEPYATRLLQAARRLRDVVVRVAESNRKAGLIAQGVLRHFRHIFGAMTGGCDRPAGYSDRGHVVSGARRCEGGVFDATG